MAYPPIPRDPSGTPLPVVWDDETQNWKIYTGVLTGVVDEGDILETGVVDEGDILEEAD